MGSPVSPIVTNFNTCNIPVRTVKPKNLLCELCAGQWHLSKAKKTNTGLNLRRPFISPDLNQDRQSYSRRVGQSTC